MRRLDVVCALCQTASPALRASPRPAHTRAITLQSPSQCRLQKLQLLPDRETARCLHRRRGKDAEPSPLGSIRSAHRAAVFDSQAICAAEITW